MLKLATRLLVGLSLVASLAMMAAAQDERDTVPKHVKAGDEPRSGGSWKWVYFVCNDPLMAVFNVDESGGHVQYTTVVDDEYVVKSMKLKYIGDDGAHNFYRYQNDVQAGGLIWFLPKCKRGNVYWAYGGTATPEYHLYGPSVRFKPSE